VVDPARTRRPRGAWLVVLLALAVFATACGEDRQPSSVTWRNVTFQVPEGWYVTEQADTRLSLSNQDIGPDTDTSGPPPEGDVVAMNLTYDPQTGPDDIRRFVQEQGATLESDESLVLDGEVPATQVVFEFETNGIPTREMYVVVPSRAIVLLAQPVPSPGDTDAPEVFLRHIETFREVLETARFGAPVLD
jgi:hypothetical protein